jgi:hypothetical protein
MQKSLRFIVALVLIGLGVWGWRVLFPAPGKIIRARLLQLARTVSFETKDGIVPRGLKAQKLPEFFTPDVVIRFDIRAYGARTWNGRDELMSELGPAMQGHRGGVKVEFLDVTVTLAPDRQTAVANLTARVTLPAENDFIVQECNLQLKKVERKWLIYRVETVKTLSQLKAVRPVPA